MNVMRSLVFACVAALCLLLGSTSRVHAVPPQGYHFTSIAETTADDFDSFYPWFLSMNNNGVVAFYGVRPGGKKIVASSYGERPVYTVFPDDVGNDTFFQTAIDDYASVAFTSGTPGKRGLFIQSAEHGLARIYDAPNEQVEYIAYNNTGSLVFQRNINRGKEYAVTFFGREGLMPVPGVA